MQDKRTGVRAGMDVVDVNGDKIGTISDVYAAHFKVETGFLGLGQDYYIPFDAVTGVQRDSVIVNAAKDRLAAMGWTEKPRGYAEGGPWNTMRTRDEEAVSGTDVTGERDVLDRDRETAGTYSTEQGEQRMPLREEELEIERRRRQTGEVHVEKDVEEETVRRNVPYTEERAYVERRPVSGDVESGEIHEGEEIRIPIREEEIEVTKRPVTREEIVIGKEEVTKEKEIEETVRREVPRVHKEGDVEERDITDESLRDMSPEERERRRRERDLGNQ